MENNVKEKKDSIMLSMTSFILAILSAASFCFIIVSCISAVISIVIGIISLVIEKKNGLSIAGLIIAIAVIIITICFYIFGAVIDVDLFMIPEWYNVL